MNLRKKMAIAALIAGVNFPLPLTHAVRTSQVHTYGFVDDASTLHIEGGFAGVDLTSAISGTFELVAMPRRPGRTLYSIQNVKTSLTGDLPWKSHLDDLLRMSEWEGVQYDSSNIQFVGFDNQGAPMLTSASIGNVKLILEGKNTPPCCDYFSYDLEATARILSIETIALTQATTGLNVSVPVTEPASGWLSILIALALPLRKWRHTGSQ